ncbi:site-specific integrase [Chitinophaga filiformis]|uniref:Site-specific integrase n=1 Tax=Chitinophaga filiformis TaxID=104663 RepID=A0ABY4HWW0_CHIFI|nr:site-specific integrase [Chitinophaga filiformis]UPK67933.1 site-specific integrase [Chitinophaga filiformis]
MNAQNTFGIDFIVRNVKGSKDLAVVYARITLNGGEPVEISLKDQIQKDQWNSESETVKGKSEAARLLNNHIDNVRFNLKRIYKELVDKCEPFEAEDIKTIYTGKQVVKNKDHTVMALIKLHKIHEGKNLAPGSLKNFGATAAYVENFIKYKYNKEDIHVSQLDFPFIKELETYIPLHPLKKHDPCHINGTAKHLDRLKQIVGWGKLMKWLKEDPFVDFAPFRIKTKTKKLKWHQIVALEKLDLVTPELAYARDLFIFSCYTGFAFADVMALTMDNFDVTPSGTFWCNHYRLKSEEFTAVPILQTAVAIIKKYKDDPRAVAKEKVFPPITNQEVNRCLKILQELARIPFTLTFHIARHTFASTVALKMGVDIKVVQMMMGHAKITTTEGYTEADEEWIEEETKGLENKIKERKQLLSPIELLEV